MNQWIRRGRSGRWATWCGLCLLLGTAAARAEEAFGPSRSEELEPRSEPWYEELEFNLFADAFANVNTQFPKPQAGGNALRAYDRNIGFSLAWVGLNVRYAPEPVGGTLSLRAGPSADVFGGSCLSRTTRCDGEVTGLGLVTQAFASWAPARGVVLDFGKFYSPYGVEVSESQNDFNYTRGLLFTLTQPWFHTGLRAAWQIVPELRATALAVNGWNNTLDNNLGKTLGLVFVYRPASELSVQLGWLGGPEQDDSALLSCPQDTDYSPVAGGCVVAPGIGAHDVLVDRGGANGWKAWRHLFDLAVRLRPLPMLDLVVQADYGRQGTRDLEPTGDTRTVRQHYYAAMLAARYALDATWAVAARAEYLTDPHGLAGGISRLKLGSGTLTLEAKPADHLLFRLEERADVALDAEASTRIFPRGARRSSSHQYTTTLGVVVMTQ